MGDTEQTCEGKSPGDPKPGITLLTCTLISIISAIIAAAGAIAAYDHYFATKIVTYDLRGFLAEETRKNISGEITDEQYRASLNQANYALKNQPKNHVVILGEVVLSHVPSLDRPAETK